MARTTLGDLRSRREPEKPDPYDPRGVPVPPGYQERLGDPTKVITDLPPTLNAPMKREAPPASSITPRMQLSMNDLGPEWKQIDLSAPPAPRDYRPEPREMTADETARNRANAAFEKPGVQSHVTENARSAAAERTAQAAHPVGGRKGEMGSPGGGLSPETLAELLRFLGGAR